MRTEIRNKLFEAIKSDNFKKVDRVVISTPEEKIRSSAHSIRASSHDLTIHIDIFLKTVGNDVFECLDQVANSIEEKIDKNPNLGLEIDPLELVNIRSQKNDEGEKTAGMLRMTYHCGYFKQRTPKLERDLPQFSKISYAEGAQ